MPEYPPDDVKRREKLEFEAQRVAIGSEATFERTGRFRSTCILNPAFSTTSARWILQDPV